MAYSQQPTVRSSQREVKPPLPMLEEDYEALRLSLVNLLSFDITELQEQPDQLVEFSKRLKTSAREVIRKNIELAHRLKNTGRVAERQRLVNQRVSYENNVPEILDNINQLLDQCGYEQLSKFDTQSNRSGFSLHSQLPSSPASSLYESPDSPEPNALGGTPDPPANGTINDTSPSQLGSTEPSVPTSSTTLETQMPVGPPFMDKQSTTMKSPQTVPSADPEYSILEPTASGPRHMDLTHTPSSQPAQMGPTWNLAYTQLEAHLPSPMGPSPLSGLDHPAGTGTGAVPKLKFANDRGKKDFDVPNFKSNQIKDSTSTMYHVTQSVSVPEHVPLSSFKNSYAVSNSHVHFDAPPQGNSEPNPYANNNSNVPGAYSHQKANQSSLTYVAANNQYQSYDPVSQIEKTKVIHPQSGISENVQANRAPRDSVPPTSFQAYLNKKENRLATSCVMPQENGNSTLQRPTFSDSYHNNSRFHNTNQTTNTNIPNFVSKLQSQNGYNNQTNKNFSNHTSPYVMPYPGYPHSNHFQPHSNFTYQQPTGNPNQFAFPSQQYSYPSNFTPQSSLPYQQLVSPFSQLQLMSNHLLEQELIKKSIDLYSGSAIEFWSWAGQVDSYITALDLSPLKTLQLLSSYCTGEPQKVISRHLASIQHVTSDDVQEVWESLVQRFGSSQCITRELRDKINKFPLIQGPNQGDLLHELHDLCKIILYNLPRCPDLGDMNLSSGLESIRRKLPEHIQNEWRKIGQAHEDSTNGAHPPFSVFVNFIKQQAKQKSNKNYETIYHNPKPQTKSTLKQANPSNQVKVFQTTAADSKPTVGNKEKAQTTRDSVTCQFHESSGHSLGDCRAFLKLPVAERHDFVAKTKLCFGCLGPHRISNCNSELKCDHCNHKHHTLLHRTRNPDTQSTNTQEKKSNPNPSSIKTAAFCTRVCNSVTGKDCSKTLLVELTMENVPNKSITCYAILDEQSNCTFVDERVIDYFGCRDKCPLQEYSVNFALNKSQYSTLSRLVSGLQVRGVLQEEKVSIPKALSSEAIADTTHEVVTPHNIRQFPHLRQYANLIPEFDSKAECMILIGRDCPRAMATVCLSEQEPFLHESPLGLSAVGNICPQQQGANNAKVSVFRTGVTPFESTNVRFEFNKDYNRIPEFDVFSRYPDDDSLGLSQDDQAFLDTMSANVTVTETGHIQLPLPLRNTNFPDNKAAVFARTKKTLENLSKNPDKLKASLASMEKSISNKFVEIAPIDVQPEKGKSWYLPIFAVSEERKNKVRLVFDASARYFGLSLNDMLIQGPDLNNQLRGVLLRLREKPYAFAADIQSMFNNFKVPEDQRDYLRFFWFRDNNPEQEVVAYRSTGHIFGCTSSPAVASFGLKFCVSNLNPEDTNVRRYVERSFYVDDGLYSTDTSEEAIGILQRSMEVLQEHNITLHKIVSNSKAVMNRFSPSETSQVHTMLPVDNPSCHKTLGVAWDTHTDEFFTTTDLPLRPFTKRGILATVNSLYDPIGFISPIVLQGRLLQRKFMPPKPDPFHEYGWDDPLPGQFLPSWNQFTDSLADLSHLRIKRYFYPPDFSPIRQEIYAFADASEEAIGHVVYIKSINESGDRHISFVSAASKVAPRGATSVPRLELCAALETSRSVSALINELENKPTAVRMYSDSQIVLGYIRNKQKRFSKYVERRVSGILSVTNDYDWNFVPTAHNPADFATRPQSPRELSETFWLTGPSFIACNDPPTFTEEPPPMPLPEEEPAIQVMCCRESTSTPFSSLFRRVNNLDKLVNVFKYVYKFARTIDVIRQKKGVQLAPQESVINREHAMRIIVRQAQNESLSHVISKLESQRPLPEKCPVSDLSPTLDGQGIVRVGGRLKNASLAFSVKHPYLIPKDHPLASTIARHFHAKNRHQGSHISHSTIIQAGFHIHGGRQLVRNLVKNCVMCRKLRGRGENQLMADLPAERLEEVPPFTHVGIDAFGPFYIYEGVNTRSTRSTKKVWALIFVCLPSRAIHLEVLPAMDTSSFRNALSRFFALRGTCRTIRSDQGTNFMSAKRQLEGTIDISQLSSELQTKGIQWITNPPAASHHGGSWERKIGSVRRVIEGSLALISHRGISRDEFATLLAEASAIVNNTPLWPHPNHPDEPSALTPQMLLTLKENPNVQLLDEFNEKDIVAYGKRRYRRVQYIVDQFWNRWQTEYLQTLTKRHKWKNKNPCVTEGDIVLVRVKNSPRNQWPLGRVESVKPSSDGLVRSVSLKIPPLPGTNTCRSIRRCINDLVLLIPSNTHSSCSN